MDTNDWIDSLARRARLEPIPPSHVAAPKVDSAAYRLPRMALSFSAIGSLAAACLILAMGLHAQHFSPTPHAPAASTSEQSDAVLFAPLKMEIH